MDPHVTDGRLTQRGRGEMTCVSGFRNRVNSDGGRKQREGLDLMEAEVGLDFVPTEIKLTLACRWSRLANWTTLLRRQGSLQDFLLDL